MYIVGTQKKKKKTTVLFFSLLESSLLSGRRWMGRNMLLPAELRVMV